MDQVTLSVLVCTYNRPDLLSQCLSALIDRTDEPPDEIVLVNGGGAHADEVVEHFGNRATPINLIKTINKNLAASRNIGLPHCTGNLIAMTDDDAQVFPDWVAQMKRAHQEHPEAGAIGGAVIGTDTHSLIGRLSDLVTFPSWVAPRLVRTLPGVNISYKREVVERVGLQDETLFRGEDVDWNWRVTQLGYQVYFDPSIRVYHHHRSTLRAFLRQHYMYGRAYYLVRRKWEQMYCVYPHHIRRVKDVLKAINFIAAMFYEPLLYLPRLEGIADKVLAYPLLLANQMAWRGGMLREKFTSR